ncbi:hypothetical protein LIER_02256 [Lithospermum erythrorhizon]|uniref:Uncharacterized protein n=1 Tax=Lithospermum erythrorhizon TaxID=34254 RepID=A0AAV3NNU5_LITER
MSKAFNGTVERRLAPPILSGVNVLKEVENIETHNSHNQKNVGASVLNTLLGDTLKSKDGLNSRMDIEFGIREELAPIEKTGKTSYLPFAAHTLSKEEKRVLLKTLHS